MTMHLTPHNDVLLRASRHGCLIRLIDWTRLRWYQRNEPMFYRWLISFDAPVCWDDTGGWLLEEPR